MPLRDHFHAPLDDETSWEGLHGQWPALLVAQLNRQLPPRYVAAPLVRVGASFEIDVAAPEKDRPASPASGGGADGAGGAATAIWAPPRPTMTLATDLPEQDEYEVRVYDSQRGRRVVAAVELVSPANKDRPENRGAFAAKCAALLNQGVSVTIVDVVTTRQFNLYGELLDLLGQTDPDLAPVPPPLYAVTTRWRHSEGLGQWDTWAYALAVGRPLPTLPLWLGADLAIPLDLEISYEQACRELRIA